MNAAREFQARINARRLALETFQSETAKIAEIAQAIVSVLRFGGRVLTCGNGGSAAEALHLAEELVGRFKLTRQPLGAFCLAADPTALTCIGNDFGFEEIFARPLRGIGRAGDVLVVLSTSGTSPNILRALEVARELGIKTVGLLGRPGSAAEALCDFAVTPNVDDPAIVQELHLTTIHVILEFLDSEFGDPD
jgi:D-sedoheptulose 7-phosphate isomerase